VARNTALQRGVNENTSTELGGYGKDRRMKKIGMILLALYVIVDSLLGFGLNLGPFIFLLYLVGLAAGVFILIGALKSSG
jgi:hypothetical protein